MSICRRFILLSVLVNPLFLSSNILRLTFWRHNIQRVLNRYLVIVFGINLTLSRSILRRIVEAFIVTGLVIDVTGFDDVSANLGMAFVTIKRITIRVRLQLAHAVGVFGYRAVRKVHRRQAGNGFAPAFTFGIILTALLCVSAIEVDQLDVLPILSAGVFRRRALDHKPRLPSDYIAFVGRRPGFIPVVVIHPLLFDRDCDRVQNVGGDVGAVRIFGVGCAGDKAGRFNICVSKLIILSIARLERLGSATIVRNRCFHHAVFEVGDPFYAGLLDHLREVLERAGPVVTDLSGL